MGGGIASVTAINAALPVRIKDIRLEGVNHALKTSWELLSKKVKRRQLTPAQRQQQMAGITGGIDYQGVSQRDVVIEAVFEDLALKQQMASEVEAHCQRIRCLLLTPLRCQLKRSPPKYSVRRTSLGCTTSAR